MPAAVEIARFRVEDGAEEQMLAERPAMVEALRRHFPAARDSVLTLLDDGTWMDVVLWDDREQAQSAANGAYDVPDLAHWFRHIAGEIAFEYADVRHLSRRQQQELSR